MMKRGKKSHSKLTNFTNKEGKKPNLWPDLPQQLIDLLARNSSLMKEVHSKGVTKSWRTKPSRKCQSNASVMQRLELAFDYENDQKQPHIFNIPFKVGCIWYWLRERPNIATCYSFIGCSQGLIVAKSVSGSPHYTLQEPYKHFGGGWNMPPWDASIPFLTAALSAYPLTTENRRTNTNKSIVMVLTGVASPAFLYYRIWEGDRKWVNNEGSMVDPFCSGPDEKDNLFRFGNGIWLKEKVYALSIQGTVAVIEDVGSDVRITRIGKRVVPCVASLHYRECMVEFGGAIFVVFLVSRKCVKKVDYVEVYELNTEELIWIKKERLRDLAVFCGVHCCMGISAKRVGFRRNCVYFSIGLGDGWWVYDMETCNISPAGTAEFVDSVDPELY